MSKVLVVYGTKTGCAAGIAEHIGKTLEERGAEVVVSAAEDKPDPIGYDAVVVGSGVRVGNWHTPVTNWINDNVETLRTVPVAFFTACLTMAIGPEKSDEVRAYTDGLLATTGLNPVDYGLFAGMNEPARFSLAERMVMKVMKAPRGDFRDWEAITAWTEGTAAKLGVV